jgi:hypothetical protein
MVVTISGHSAARFCCSDARLRAPQHERERLDEVGITSAPDAAAATLRSLDEVDIPSGETRKLLIPNVRQQTQHAWN